MNEPLRPFTLGEILDRTAQLYRRNFLLYAGVAAAPTGVLVAVFIGCGALIGTATLAAKPSMSSDMRTGLIVIGLLLVGLPVGLAATVVSHAAMTRTAVSTHMGEAITIREAIRSVWPRFWRYLWLLILQVTFCALVPAVAVGAMIALVAYAESVLGYGTGASAMAGFLAFVFIVAAFVYVIWCALGFSMAMAVCVVEGRSARESLSRSVKLCKETRGRIFVMGLLVWAISVVLSIVAYIPLVIVVAIVTAAGHGAQYAAITTIVAEIVNVFLNFALQTLLTPVYMTALVLFYYDQRIRTEGYDIELMMERAGLTGPENIGAAAQPNSGTASMDISPVDGL